MALEQVQRFFNGGVGEEPDLSRSSFAFDVCAAGQDSISRQFSEQEQVAVQSQHEPQRAIGVVNVDQRQLDLPLALTTFAGR